MLSVLVSRSVSPSRILGLKYCSVAFGTWFAIQPQPDEHRHATHACPHGLRPPRGWNGCGRRNLETRVHIMAVPRPFRVCNLTLPLLYTKSVFKPHPDAVLNKCRIRGTISTDCLRCLGSILQTNLAIQTWKGKNAFRGPRQLGSGSQLVTQKGRPCLVPQAWVPVLRPIECLQQLSRRRIPFTKSYSHWDHHLPGSLGSWHWTPKPESFSADILEHNLKAAGTGTPNGRQPALQPWLLLQLCAIHILFKECYVGSGSWSGDPPKVGFLLHSVWRHLEDIWDSTDHQDISGRQCVTGLIRESQQPTNGENSVSQLWLRVLGGRDWLALARAVFR